MTEAKKIPFHVAPGEITLTIMTEVGELTTVLSLGEVARLVSTLLAAGTKKYLTSHDPNDPKVFEPLTPEMDESSMFPIQVALGSAPTRGGIAANAARRVCPQPYCCWIMIPCEAGAFSSHSPVS
jgi:hypothetical protein